MVAIATMVFLVQMAGIVKPRQKKCPPDIFLPAFRLAPVQLETWQLPFQIRRLNNKKSIALQCFSLVQMAGIEPAREVSPAGF